MNDRNTHSPNESEPAAIYVRISADKAGRSLGVERQEEACRALAADRGWDVAQVFSDNDLSAYSGKRRPGYEKLLDLMKSGRVRVVVAIHTDRLHRSPTELESFITLCEASDVRVETVQAGPVDLSTATGRMGARIYGAVARHEVEHSIERMQAAKLQAAQNGEFLGGQRPYGFEPRREGIRESEAAIIREMAAAVIEGRSFWSIAVDLNRREILTQHGKDWNSLKVRNLLMRDINAGIVFHRGIRTPAKSPAILEMDVWRDLQSMINLNRWRSKHPGRTRKHLLNGFLFCGECGMKMFHKSKEQRTGGYKTTAACGKSDAQTGRQHGCGGVSRMVEPIIDLITDAVLYRLDSPDVAEQLRSQKTDNESMKSLYTRQHVLEARLNEITDDYYVKSILTREEFERLKLTTDAELHALAKRIEDEAPTISVGALDIGKDVRAAWEKGDLKWRRELLFELIDKVIVHRMPRTEGYTYPKYKDKWRFDPELIEIRWKV